MDPWAGIARAAGVNNMHCFHGWYHLGCCADLGSITSNLSVARTFVDINFAKVSGTAISVTVISDL